MIRRLKALAAAVPLVLAVVTATLTAFGGNVSAQQTTTSGGNALKISPVRSDLTIKPGVSQTIDVYVQNLTQTKADLHPIVNDFTVNKGNESGQPDIILNENQSAPTHSLKQYVKAPANFSLQPNEQKDIKVTIAIPATAKAGGYYGAVRFAPVSSNTDKNVTLSASVGSLILVKVPGDIKEQVSVASFDARKGDNASSFFISNKGVNGVVRFDNSGDVQEQPFGKILLKNQSGKVLGSYEINNADPRGNVLPDSIRRFDVSLDKLGSFGKFTIEGNFGYGSNGQLLTATKTFYVVPVYIIVLAVAVILLLLFLIFVVPRLVKAYNRRIVSKATGRR